MEVILTSIITAVISGVILSMIKTKLDESARAAKKANAYEFDLVKSAIKIVEDRLVSVEKKVDYINVSFHKMDKKMAILSVEHEHLKDEVDSDDDNSDHNGRVIRKP